MHGLMALHLERWTWMMQAEVIDPVEDYGAAAFFHLTSTCCVIPLHGLAT